MARKRIGAVGVQSPEGQATLDALADLEAALAGLDPIITALAAGGGAFDAATPAERTIAIRRLARAVRAIALLLRGLRVPLGNAQVPD